MESNMRRESRKSNRETKSNAKNNVGKATDTSRQSSYSVEVPATLSGPAQAGDLGFLDGEMVV